MELEKQEMMKKKEAGTGEYGAEETGDEDAEEDAGAGKYGAGEADAEENEDGE